MPTTIINIHLLKKNHTTHTHTDKDIQSNNLLIEYLLLYNESRNKTECCK